jgi:hypothetical protein
MKKDDHCTGPTKPNQINRSLDNRPQVGNAFGTSVGAKTLTMLQVRMCAFYVSVRPSVYHAVDGLYHAVDPLFM